MNQNFFRNLPSEITVNILSRLPIPTVECCKCVCKSWLDLVGTREFVKSHLSKSVPALLVYEHQELSMLCEIFDFEDGLDLTNHELHYNLVTKISLPDHGKILGSVDGLILICDKGCKTDSLFICNPITCDYIKLVCTQECGCIGTHVAYGFGVSKKTAEYKVVTISYECHQKGNEQLKMYIPEWQVYTLGTRSWRKIIAPPDLFYLNGCPSLFDTRDSGTFLNGILYWLVCDLNGHPQISCFDLETETLSGLSSPLPHQAALCALGDSLCLCDSTSVSKIVIWLVKERGDKKIWEKVLVICKSPEVFHSRASSDLLIPLRVFKDGDVLFKLDGCAFLFYYSKKKKPVPFDTFRFMHEAIIYTPSFLSLKRITRRSSHIVRPPSAVIRRLQQIGL